MRPSRMVALECRVVRGWLKEVSLKAPLSVEGAVPCIRGGRYDMTEGNCERKLDHHCVVLLICESVTSKLPWVKIQAISPHLLVMPPRGDRDTCGIHGVVLGEYLQKTIDDGGGKLGTSRDEHQKNPNPSPVCHR